ncbi:MAG: ABC transporter permease [Cyclobacteriaceae bacterium]
MMESDENVKEEAAIPKLASALLEWFCAPHWLTEIEGDLQEQYNENIEEKGILKAKIICLWEVIRFLRPHIIKKNKRLKSTGMFKNYFRVTFNNILNNKVNSTINILGLSIGIALCMVIMLYVSNELSYDQFHSNTGKIYRIALQNDPGNPTKGLARASYGMSEVLKDEFPAVETVARMTKLFNQEAVVQNGDKHFKEERLYFAEPSIFEVLDFTFIEGNPSTALVDPNTIVITERSALKYFGSLDVIGKTLNVNLNNMNVNYEVIGLLSDPPENTHFKYDLLVPLDDIFALINPRVVRSIKSWYTYNFWTYVKLNETSDAVQFEKDLTTIVDNYFPPTRKDIKIFIQPVEDIHLHSHLDREFEANNDIFYIRVLTSIAILVLVIACINFMNLTTARSIKRAKEVGIRKTLGAKRGQLIVQFLTESFIVTFVSILLALLFVAAFVGTIDQLAFINLEVSHLGIGSIILGLLFLNFAIGLLAGLYPAFILSALQSVKTLKGSFSKSLGSKNLRSGLVMVQMSVTVILLFGILTISNQLDFMRTKKLGFEKEQIVLLDVAGTSLSEIRQNFKEEQYQKFKSRVLQIPEVKNVTKQSRMVGAGASLRSIFFNGISDNEKEAVQFLYVGHDFASTYDLTFVEGRDFSTEYSTDTVFMYIVNEAAVTAYELEDQTIGRRIASGDNVTFPGQIVGVVKDFHFAPLHEQIEPLVVGLSNFPMQFVSLKIDTEQLQETLAQINAIYKEIEPNRPMDYSFLDKRLDDIYQFEATLEKVIVYFTGLAIFISCLGLFGMALYMAEQKTKEIAIRKVLGASVNNVVVSFNVHFVKLVLIANLIALPIGYYLLNDWLNGFAYRTSPDIGMFALVCLITIIITLFTVSYQSLRAGLSNPVDSLSCE